MEHPTLPIPTGLTLADLLDALDRDPVGITAGRLGEPCTRYVHAYGSVRYAVSEILATAGESGVDRLRAAYAATHVITLGDSEYEALRAMAVERSEAVEHARRLHARRLVMA